MTPAKNLLDRTTATLSRVLLDWAARRVHPAQREWIDAVRGELEEVGAGPSQLMWSLGALRLVWQEKWQALAQRKHLALPIVALMILFVAPFQRVHVLVPTAACVWLILRRVHPSAPKSGPSLRTLQAAVLAGVAACLALAAYGVTHYPIGSGSPSLSTAVFLGILASYAGIALAWSSSPTTATTALRYGVTGGVGTGCLSLLGSLPLMLAGSGWITMVVVPVAPIAIGMWASSVSGHVRAGLEAGFWSGLIGALIFFVGLVSLTYAATGWFTHAPQTVADFQNSWSREQFDAYRNHYHSISTFVVSDNLGQASVWLSLTPTLSTIFGAVGGMLGARPRPARSGEGDQ